MARTGKLSAVEVAKAKGPAVLHDGGGLYLRVSGSGAKSWVYRYQLNGKRRDMGLGPYPDISLAEAREKATAHRRQRHDGTDPPDARQAQRQAERVAIAKGRSFREAAKQFIESNKAGWRNAKHRQQWGNTLSTYVYDEIGDVPVSAIDTEAVLRVLEPIWTTKPETASRVRGRIEAVLDAAKVRGFREGPNPAQWRGNLALLLPSRAKVRKVVHHAALPFVGMPDFLADLRPHKGLGARALEFTILTAARTSETLGATWREIDLDAKVWTVPALRMKAEREHRVPLSPAAVAVLMAVRPLALQKDGEPDPSAPIFPGRRRALPEGTDVIQLVRKSDYRRSLETKLDEDRRMLADQGDGYNEAHLREQASEVDVDTTAAEVTQLETEITRLQGELQEAAQAGTVAEGDLRRLRDSEGIREVAQKANDAAAEMAAHVGRWVRLRAAAIVLNRALERYRAQNQNPLVRRASDIFSAIAGTGENLIVRLSVDYTDEDHPVLVGFRRDGSICPVSGMSDGTVDQLYLALRIAAVERHMEGGEPMPFIADDLFITSDEERTKPGIKALAELGRHTQVLLFTHHKYVLDAAADALAAGQLKAHFLNVSAPQPLAAAG